MTTITQLLGRQLLDSRGNPTLEVEVHLKGGAKGRAAVPAGASKGKYEAVELRDQLPDCYHGKSVYKAVEYVNGPLRNAFIGLDASHQSELDQRLITLDNTPNKSYLGANTLLGISLALAHAAAAHTRQPLYRYLGGEQACQLPVPLMNIINGGAHASNGLSIQEFMIVPTGAKTYSQAVQMGAEIYHTLKEILKQHNYSTNVGDEGGFAPDLKDHEEAMDLILAAIFQAGYVAGKDVYLAIDAASTEYYDSLLQQYTFKSEKKSFNSQEMVAFWEEWVEKYPILSLEDPLAEDDWEGWALLTSRLGNKVQLVGDDLFVTQVDRLQQGIHEQVANAILIKLNQVGTLTETLTTLQLAKTNRYGTVLSHRSGETEDTTIAHLAVAFGLGQIKAGAPARGERTAKYNELLRIQEDLGEKARYEPLTLSLKS